MHETSCDMRDELWYALWSPNPVKQELLSIYSGVCGQATCSEQMRKTCLIGENLILRERIDDVMSTYTVFRILSS